MGPAGCSHCGCCHGPGRHLTLREKKGQFWLSVPCPPASHPGTSSPPSAPSRSELVLGQVPTQQERWVGNIRSITVASLESMVPQLALPSMTALPASAGSSAHPWCHRDSTCDSCPRVRQPWGRHPASRESGVEGDTEGTQSGGKLGRWAEVPEPAFSIPLAMTRDKPSTWRAHKVSFPAPNPEETPARGNPG